MGKVVKCAFGEFDTTKFPIIRFTATKNEPSLEDIKEYNRLLKEVIDSTTGDYVFIADGTDIKWLNGDARVEVGKEAKRLEELYIPRYKMCILVIPNVIVNMIMKGINLILKSKVPQVYCKSIEEAMKLAEEEVMAFNQVEALV